MKLLTLVVADDYRIEQNEPQRSITVFGLQEIKSERTIQRYYPLAIRLAHSVVKWGDMPRSGDGEYLSDTDFGAQVMVPLAHELLAKVGKGEKGNSKGTG